MIWCPLSECGAQESSLKREIPECSKTVGMYLKSLQKCHLFGHDTTRLTQLDPEIWKTGLLRPHRRCWESLELAKQQNVARFLGVQPCPPSSPHNQTPQVIQLGRILTCGLGVSTPLSPSTRAGVRPVRTQRDSRYCEPHNCQQEKISALESAVIKHLCVFICVVQLGLVKNTVFLCVIWKSSKAVASEVSRTD